MTCDVRGAVRGQGELDEIFAAKPDLDSLPTRETCRFVVVSGTDTSDLDPKDFAAILKKPIHDRRARRCAQGQ